MKIPGAGNEYRQKFLGDGGYPVEKQSFYPNQILIIDGSIDDTTAIHFGKSTIANLEYYKVSASQRGLTKQRNFGVERVKQGIDYISFLDDDVVFTQS